MLTCSQVKQCITDIGRGPLEDILRRRDGEEIIEAAFACGVAITDIDEAYQGKFKSDEAFVRNLMEELGDIPKELEGKVEPTEQWINDVMMDYCEDNGFYFRNL